MGYCTSHLMNRDGGDCTPGVMVARLRCWHRISMLWDRTGSSGFRVTHSCRTAVWSLLAADPARVG